MPAGGWASAAQAKFMWARHPSIARKWTREFGGWSGLPEHANSGHKGGKGGSQHMNMTPTGTPSNESWHPTTTALPRIPGLKRDYGMLKPSSSARHKPAGPTPNEHESTRESPVEGLHGSRAPFHHLQIPTHPTGFAGRDGRTAFNPQAKRKGT